VPADIAALRNDLAAEQESLDHIIAHLDPAAWDVATPAEGWTVRDQVTHLAFFDERARTAAEDPDRFTRELAAVAADPDAYVERHLERGRRLPPAQLLGWWRGERQELLEGLARLDPSARVPWYGPAMSVASFTSARLMETWCHGQDVADALGVDRLPTRRLRHVAHLAVAARPFNYASHGRALPEGGVFVTLRGPDGATWEWGDPAAADRVEGDALDFCLVATQRRHRDDTDLRIEGPLAQEWMAIAQAFAGPPGPGRRPGQFTRRGRG
jgi:uncharacterized protein (TIGR03084 family)